MLLTRHGDIRGWAIHSTIPDVDATDVFYLHKVDGVSGDQLTLCIMAADITAGAETFVTYATDSDVYIQVWGKSPSYFGVIPYDYNDTPGSYLFTGAYGKPTVIMTQGGAGAAVYVSVQEFKVY